VRADRLISTLLLLQVHGRLTSRDLADRLEISERTVLRDMDALTAAGVPVVADRGPAGGWRLLDGYQTKLTGLTAAEIQTLFFAHPPQLLEALGLGRAAEAAWLKLQAALPAASQRRAERARRSILIDPMLSEHVLQLTKSF
jgi:predicted DNA-binding transcriptional regulator YafY